MKDIITKIDELALFHAKISPRLVKEKNIKLGLRNSDGSGVNVGITSKGRVVGYEKIQKPNSDEYKVKPVEGRLIYCGYDVANHVEKIHSEDRYGFDEITYLLLTGELPNEKDLREFSEKLVKERCLTKIEKSVMMQETENSNQMYALHSIVSHLSRCDKNPDSTELTYVTQQCFNLIAKFPTIVAHNYNIMKYKKGGNLSLMNPDPSLSTAENFLYMLKGKKPTKFEGYLFDLAMILHAEHGGGNNSTFTVRTVSSSAANTYMAICSGIASLSGHLHGGANESVMKMMKDIKNNVKDITNEKKLKAYLEKILDKKAHDKTGKIYGMGHAVYTLSDPRAILLREQAKKYAEIKGATKEFEFFDLVADISQKLFKKRKGIVISPNVDFYSGFVYKLLGIPSELFTPIFAMARVVGWSAHRIEQIIQSKIIRPAYVSSLSKEEKYIPLNKRK
jgi:citrate synthase